MTLKTLKDINDEERESYKDLGEDYGEWVDVEILKQEAIKWIKEDIETDGRISIHTLLWIKRLSITEEDLQ